MAFVSAGFFGSVSLQDNGGNVTTVEYQLTAADNADANTAMGTILTALQNASDGVILNYDVRQRFDNDTVGFPASGVQAEVSASLTTLINGAGGKKANIRIPMPKPSLFIALSGDGANNVNLTNTNVLAYHALFTTGQQAFLSDGEVAGALKSGVRVTRRARRG